MDKEKITGFVAYPCEPANLSEIIVKAIEEHNKTNKIIYLHPWEDNDIAGRPITAPIMTNIEKCRILFADISVLNFNVTYEVGYAIGRKKRIFITKYSAFRSNSDEIQQIGIFDTLGYKEYANVLELNKLFASVMDQAAIPYSADISRKDPVYILQSPIIDEPMTRILSATKKHGLFFRSFNPGEQVRLPAIEAIEQVAISHGVIVPYLSKKMESWEIHNIRAAFICGLAHGMEKRTLILSEGKDIIPMDIRDYVKSYSTLDEINHHIADFSSAIIKLVQKHEDKISRDSESQSLNVLDIGSATAENEAKNLVSYYIRTDEYQKALRGEADIITGRKGTGKTALFFQIRDDLRRDKKNILLDFKPAGYQLKKLKEEVLQYLEQGTAEHLMVAFWEYLLLLEICRKILEKDKDRHLRDQDLYSLYIKLDSRYKSETENDEGDFSERLMKLTAQISDRFASIKKGISKLGLTTNDITNLLYSRNLRILRSEVTDYLKYKQKTWILFDNLDKGWVSHGISPEDVSIIRSLIVASNKLEKTMQKKYLDFKAIIFIRDDVYQMLVSETSDRGKDTRITLDWNDPDLLKEMVKKRLSYSMHNSKMSFSELWSKYFVETVQGVDSFEYILQHSLMRPRYLLNIITYSKGFAVNLGHDVIGQEDILKGLRVFSEDLLIDTDHEICDVCPKARKFIYEFIGESSEVLSSNIIHMLDRYGVSSHDHQKIVSILLWYGFLGVVENGREAVFIYSMGYNMDKINALTKKKYERDPVYAINRAFWPSLKISNAS